MKTGANDITTEWQLYHRGVDYNNRINYYANVDRNILFYNGDQWKGVQANGLPTPVFNIFKRVINYFIAAIMSQKISGKYTAENLPTEPQDEQQMSVKELVDKMTAYVEIKWENDKMDTMLREALLDGALSGDMCAYTYWDGTIETGQEAQGDFRTELVDGGNVMFGNPNTNNVDKQPYILIVGRDMVSALKEEAKRNGVPDLEVDAITSDEDTTYQAGQYGKVELNEGSGDRGKCLYIIKFWKKDGYVWFSKSTKHAKIRNEVNMGIKSYPVAFANWDKVKNSYHGQAVGTGIIPNQIYINKQFAMTMLWMMYSAYGKVAIDETRVTGWTNKIGEAIKVNGDIGGAIQQLSPGSMNTTVLQVIDKAISYTKDMLGANDGALGEINPEKASGAAIVAVQKQASVPLENVKANLYQFVEDIYRIWGEFMLRKYTADRVIMRKDGDNLVADTINTTPFQDILMRVRIDVGPSNYYSEISSMQTLDALLSSGHIDILQYLKRLPDGILPKKQELIDELEQRIEQQKGMPGQSMPGDAGSDGGMNDTFESMAQFMESLPQDMQESLQSLPPDEMEKTLLEMMQGGGIQ